MGDDLGPILVTGAGGYLGRHVLGVLKARQLRCFPTSLSGRVGESCDLTDHVALRRLLARTRPSVILHCAAIVPKTLSAYDDHDAAETSLSMVRILSKVATCRIVLASSMTVYSGVTRFPVSEDRIEPPEAVYGRGKWLAEQALFRRQSSDDVALRLPGLFGPPRRSGLLYHAARAFLKGEEFLLAASTEIWAAMAVADAAHYLVQAAMTPTHCAPQAVNVGYEGEFTMPAAVAQIAAHCRVNWTPPANPVRAFSMCLQRLESRYGTLAVTFTRRLQEFVDIVRRDVASEANAGLHGS